MSTEQPKLLELEERNLTPDGLWEAAQDASAELEKAELEYLDAEDWLKEQRWRLEKIKTNTTIRVAAEKIDPTDENSKPRFTNDTQRGAEVAERLSKDPQHRELLAALGTNEKAQAVRKIHIDRLYRDYQLAKLAYQYLAIGRRGYED